MPHTDVFSSLFVASFALLIGTLVFGRFEEPGGLARRLVRAVIFVVATGALHLLIGAWAILLPVTLVVVGLVYHVAWCRKHGINWITVEPRARYLELRGWKE